MAIKKLLSKVFSGASPLQVLFNKELRSKLNELINILNQYEINDISNLSATLATIKNGQTYNDLLLYTEENSASSTDTGLTFYNGNQTTPKYWKVYLKTSDDTLKILYDTNRDFSTALTWASFEDEDVKFEEAATLTVGSNYSGNTGVEIGNSSNSGTTAYLDFSFGIGSSQDFNFRIINAADEELEFITPTGIIAEFKNNQVIFSRQSDIVFGQSNTGNTGVEIGNSSNSGTAVFIDFHFGIGSSQDYNYRLINGADEQVDFQSATDGTTLRLKDNMQLPEKSSTPSTPATGYVGIYPTDTSGKLRMVYDDGSVYEISGSLVT